MKATFLSALRTTTTLSAILIALPAAAQETAPPAQPGARSANELEEIVVTARMRTESLQSVPVSVAAFSATQIEDAKIDKPGDFINMTANMSVALSQSAGLSFITIRGIPQVRNGEPPVAVIMDGVLQISERQFTRELFDIQSIEVVRGPQGALYGRNAIGGAIIINTKQPTNDFEGNVRVGYGTGDDYVAQGSISGPIIEDKLLFRVGARYQDREGYFNNINLNKKVDPYEDTTVRGLLLWTPTDNVTAQLNGSISRTTGGANNFQYQAAILTPDGRSLDTSLPFPFDFTKGDADDVNRNFIQTNIGHNDRDIDEVSLKVDFEQDFGTISSTTSYNRIVEFIAGDQFPYTRALTQSYFGGTFVADGGQTQYATVKAWSQEFRITSRADQRFRWMTGVYYLDTKRFISTTTSDDRGQGLLRVEHDPFFTDPRNPTLSFLADDNHNKAWAVFGNVAYDLLDNLELSVAARYDKDKREQRVDPRNTSGVPGALNRMTFDKLQPKVALRYQATDDVLLYGSWGVGFRSGQFNQNGVREAAQAANVQGVEDFTPAKSVNTYELGFKTEIFDKRIRVNGSLFHTDDKGPAYFVFLGAIGAQVLVPIDKVRLRGGELEVVARAAPGLDLFGSVGITDNEVRAYRVNPAAVGNHAPYIPSYTFNAGAQYRRDISDKLAFMIRADYELRGKQYWDPENTTARSAIDIVNLRVGLEDPDRTWSITGSVENLTDTVYNSEYVSGGFAHPAPPRIWRVDLRYNF